MKLGNSLLQKNLKNIMLESIIKQHIKNKDNILLMTHLVLGYPSFEKNKQLVEQMSMAEVELIELQIPYSDPISDGPIINEANQTSLQLGTTVEKCFNFITDICKNYPNISFLCMSYCNILFRYGFDAIIERSASLGIEGWIVPDLPPEQASRYISACKINCIDPIFIFTPYNTLERLKIIDRYASGMIYCTLRGGVTGTKTELNENLLQFLKSYRQATDLPLAVGFGIQEKKDLQQLKNKVEIAVIGSKIIDIQRTQDADAVGKFLAGIR